MMTEKQVVDEIIQEEEAMNRIDHQWYLVVWYFFDEKFGVRVEGGHQTIEIWADSYDSAREGFEKHVENIIPEGLYIRYDIVKIEPLVFAIPF